MAKTAARVSDAPDFLRISEAAALLRVSPARLYEDIAAGTAGTVRALRFGRAIRISRCEVERLLSGHNS